MDVQPSSAGFGDLYRDHSRAVYRFALGLSGNAAEAEDLTAEAFLRIWEAGDRVQLGSVRAYLLTIVRNLYRQQWRRERRRGEMPEVVAGASGQRARDELRAVLAELQTLPEVDRAALLLHVEHELPYNEIAVMLGIEATTARTKVHRARERLRSVR
ncbi:MAG TPA: sigma-70 family RNA polymerase sigma factor [Paludibaculum sp.]|jgi:RNA polymerase sigma-70 factor (ECF subfamily)